MTNPAIKNPRAEHDFVGRTCSISAVGSYVPEKVLTNADLEKLVDTTDEWITTRTGIKERRIAADDEYTSDMATWAAKRALDRAEGRSHRCRFDHPGNHHAGHALPRHGLSRAGKTRRTQCGGLRHRGGLLRVRLRARDRAAVHHVPHVRHRAGDRCGELSSIVDWEDRNTCVLFGDGAGAAVLQNRENTHGLLTACMGADGRKASILSQPGGGCLHPASSQSISDRLHYLRMDGQEVFKNAVTAMATAAREALARCELEIDSIKCIIPHQANMRILKAVGDRLGAHEDQVFSNLQRYGNTSAASVAIAWTKPSSRGK